jgi:transcriptional regulator with XRE-family HTH domain
MVLTLTPPRFAGNNVPDISKSFGEWLSGRRVRAGLGTRALADKAGISHATISRLEDNKVGASKEMIIKIADALDVPRSDAIKAWLEDDLQQGQAIRYIADPDEARVVESYSGLPPRDKKLVRSLLEQLEEAERQESIGGGMGREVVPDDGDTSSSAG